MKKLLLGTLFISTIALSQVPKLELNAKGIEPLVVNVAITPASTIYAKTISWLEKNYDNPDKIIVSRDENKELNIKAVEPKVWTANRIGVDSDYGIEYTLKIQFKDGKYRITYNLGNFEKDGKKLDTSYKDLFRKHDGSIKYGYNNAVAGIEEHLNKKVQSLYDFILGKNSNNDW